VALTAPEWASLILYMDAWVDYPELCQATLDGSNAIWRERVRTSAQILAAQMARAQIQDATVRASLWPRWQVAMLGLVVGAVAFGVGAVFGWAAGL